MYPSKNGSLCSGEWLNKVVRSREKFNKELDFSDVVKFVEHLARLAADPSYSQSAYLEDANPKTRCLATQIQVKIVKCLLCDGDHLLERCDKFKGMHLQERVRFIFHNYLCYSCFVNTADGHVAKSCPS